MPRNLRKAERQRESVRLIQLREVMGLTQRQLATEFNVSHGAIAAWESGKRTIPGPALRLLELFEAETGPTPTGEGLLRLKTSTLSRSLALSRTAARLFTVAAGSAVEQLLADEQQADSIRVRARTAVARHLVRNLGDLKGLAMKMGQHMAYTFIGQSEEARHELGALLQQSRPMAAAIATQVLLEELGEPPGVLFAEWSPIPFAAASIGQVHRARLHSGEEVAVKVQYPAIVDTLRSDLRSLAFLDRLSTVILRGQSRGELLAELRERVGEECDYRVEARNQTELRALWAERRGIRIPRVFPELSSQRVLVTEFVHGENFESFRARASQAEKDEAGTLIARFAVESIFRHHLFPADPHPGNYLFAKGEVVFIDFGCVKRFPAPLVADWRRLNRAILERRFEEVRQTSIDLGWVPDPARYDFHYHFRMLQKLNEPWLYAGPYRFSDDYIRDAWRVLATENPNKFRTNTPKDWVFAPRLMYGLCNVLARLDASMDFRDEVLRMIYDPGAQLPAPYSPAELAILRTGDPERPAKNHS